MISPNFGIQAAGSNILTGPWAHQLTPLVAGKTRSWDPISPQHAHAATTSYPSVALIPMAATVDLANAVDHSKIDVPALFIYSPYDKIVRPDLTEIIAEKWGGGGDTIKVEEDGDPSHHVITGRFNSPQTTEFLVANIVEWIESL